ncbi:hypothetical protein P3T37_001566 [Kitasatospora sp. MAA4]|uniref:hypothetical protein n=1 Tax=Kitasatospora sp. MAA4 TaxID=3035093 RepID=UPI00247432E6|nr:hypothetical protein [Kitasatospora sp. MAA4]MDH6132181.1 hypothetical protein [Kitasatospora sp. MAA4]
MTRGRRWTAALAALLAVAAALTLHGGGGRSTRAAACDPWSVTVHQTSIQGRLMKLHLLNYYPSAAPWTALWTDWDPDRIGADFAAIAGLGANAVRIVLQPEVFGYPTPSADRLAQLRRSVELAAQHGLSVQLTLFDWWDGYPDTAGSDRWARAVLAPYRDDPRIAFVELKNEVDPADRPTAAWLRHELPVVRQAAGGTPVTVSVTGPDPVARLRTLRTVLAGDPPDFYDLHYYGAAGAARATFEAAEAAVAPAALFVGETGAATGPPLSEAAQDLYLRSVEWAATSAGLPDAAPWIFQDLIAADVPAGAERGASALSFGLLRTDGTAKPAAAAVRALFQGRSVDPAFNGDFGQGLGRSPADWSPNAVGGAEADWDQGSAVLARTADSSTFTVTPVLQPTAAGEPVRMTAWARGERSTGQNRIAITWYDRLGRYLGEDDSPVLPAGTTPWRLLTVDSAAPRCAAFAALALKSQHDTGQARFDDVTFRLQELTGWARPATSTYASPSGQGRSV